MTRIGLSYEPARAATGRYVRRADLLGLAAASLLAGPATAQSFTPPAQCEAFLTVQAKDCRVATYWTCPDDPPDAVWEGVHDQDGGYSLALYDAEFQWLEIRYFDGWQDRLVTPAPDPISMTELLARGWDAYEFELRSETGGAGDGDTRTTVRGIDVLTGETEEIDGETLLKTRFQIAYSGADGAVESVSSGAQYFSPVHRLFFFGTETLSDADGTGRFDSSPVTFAYPGEPGFAETRPAFGCTGAPDTVKGKKAAGGKE